MDASSKYFYAATRTYEFKRATLTVEENATLQKRKDIRKNLKCKNFDWLEIFIFISINIVNANMCRKKIYVTLESNLIRCVTYLLLFVIETRYYIGFIISHVILKWNYKYRIYFSFH